jgi:hypothetical protein
MDPIYRGPRTQRTNGFGKKESKRIQQ